MYSSAYEGILSVLAEASYIYLPFVLISILIKTPTDRVSPFLTVLLLGLLAGVLNWVLLRRPQRILVLLGVNILGAFLASWAFFAALGLPGAGASIVGWLWFDGHSVWGCLQVWLVFIMFSWVCLRAMLIFGREASPKEPITRFEVSTGVVLGTGILMGILSIPLLQSLPAVFVCLLCNWAVIARSRVNNIPARYFSAGIMALAATVAALGVILQNLLPVLSSGSAAVYDSAGPFLVRLLVGTLGWLFKKGHFVEDRGSSIAPDASSASGGAVGTPAPLPNPHWMEVLASVFLWVAVGMLVLVIAAGLIYLLLRLWRRREARAPQARNYGGPTWQVLLAALRELTANIGRCILLLLPGKKQRKIFKARDYCNRYLRHKAADNSCGKKILA
jgi:hypothetical protein